MKVHFALGVDIGVTVALNAHFHTHWCIYFLRETNELIAWSRASIVFINLKLMWSLAQTGEQ